MGTTSDKLSYLSTTKDKLKTAINYTGANITNDTFRSYPEKLYNAYIDILNKGTQELFDSLPKVQETGTSITLNNTKEAPMKLDLKGNTYQDGEPTPTNPIDIHNVSGDNTINIFSDNIFDSSFNNTTHNNISISYNDGVITLNGTANASSGVFLNDILNIILPKGTFTLILQYISGSNTGTCRIALGDSSLSITSDNEHRYFSFVIPNNNTSNIVQTIDNTKNKIIEKWGIYINNAITFNNYKFRLYIMKGTYTSSNIPEYKPYQEVQSQLISLGVDMPSGYTRLDYIESSGTQYIDTGYVVNSNTTISLKGGQSTGSGGLLGVRNNDNTNVLFIASGSNKITLYYGRSVPLASSETTGIVDNNITLTPTQFYLNKTLIGTYSPTYQNLNLCLFALNTNGVINAYSSSRIYYLKISENGVLVRNLIPCKRNSDSAIGMLDLKHNVFYENQGTGTFTYGTEYVNGIELCIIGDHQDYIYKDSDKWYKYSEVEKISGNVNWIVSNIASNNRAVIPLEDIGYGKCASGYSLSQCLSNYFISTSQSEQSSSATINTISANNDNVYIKFDSTINTKELAKAELDSMTYLTIYYPLATPKNTEITDTTLIGQFNNLEQIKSKKNQTNINQENNDLPFIITASAIKEYE